MRRGIENPDSFILLVQWDSVDDHMKGFRESPAFTEWRALLRAPGSPRRPRWNIMKRQL